MIRCAIAMGVVLGLFSMQACTTTRGLPDPVACLQIDDNTVRLRGEINDAMALCAQQVITADTTRVVVNTPGGDTRAGRAIARHIAKLPRTLVIDGECSSSCGNYFVPAAHRLEATPGSFIAIHGTPDPALVERSRRDLSEQLASAVLSGEITEAERQVTLDEFRQRGQENLDAEAAFADDFGVPKGWRLFRETPDASVTAAFAEHFEGGPRPVRQRGAASAILIVEPALLESCLPGVDPGNYRTNFEVTVIGDAREKAALERRSGVFSGSLTCKPPEGAPVS
ncbi:MAG: hypothetical protein AAF829_02145 [Pseudomonadota bacterium]